MKTFVSFLGLILMAGSSAEAVAAERGVGVPAACRDTIWITEYDNNRMVGCRGPVADDSVIDCALHYRMNRAQFHPEFEGNDQALERLKGLFRRMEQDPDMHVQTIIIRGTASPDGPGEFNRGLAEQRASRFGELMAERYPCCRNCTMEIRSDVADWEDCCEAVCHSDIPDKERVLAVLRSSDSSEDKQARLEGMPGAWAYLCREILPDMRRVDLTVGFEGESSSPCCTESGEIRIVDYDMTRGQTRKMERREARKSDELEQRAKDTDKALDKIDRSVGEYVDDTLTAVEDAEIRMEAEQEKAQVREEQFSEREKQRLTKKEERYARRLKRKAMKAEKKAHRNLEKVR